MPLEIDEISIQQQFEEVIASENKLQIKEFLNDQNISDVADLIYDNEDFDTQIITHLSLHRAASVFKVLELSNQKKLVKDLPAFNMAELLNELPPDDRTAFLSELPSNAVRELIKTLNPEERKVTLSLLGYPEGSVGRLMTPDYIYVYEHDTVEDVLNTIRKYAKNTETIDVIYVINDKGELLDDIRIKDFIMASADKRVDELMDGRVITLHAEDDQEVANEAFKMNNRVALPVVSKSNKLLGIVTIDDVLWVTNEEFSEDMQKMGGTEVLGEPYIDIPFFKLIKKRVGWLMALFLSEMLTTTAMTSFSVEMEKVAILGIFIPLIMSSGGNSGSQASTLIIQAMAMGELYMKDWWRVMKREILSGLTLGIILGLVGFIRIALWHYLIVNNILNMDNNLEVKGYYVDHFLIIGTTIGLALVGIVLWGSLMGSMLPILLKRLGADPAASSAPFVATLVDVTGIIIYFSVALLFLKGTLL